MKFDAAKQVLQRALENYAQQAGAVELSVRDSAKNPNKVKIAASLGAEKVNACALFEEDEPAGNTTITFQRRGGCHIWFLKVFKELKTRMAPSGLSSSS